MILKTQKRVLFGKKNKTLRNKGFFPAIIYGSGTENIPLSIKARDFEKTFKEAGETTLIQLEIEGESGLRNVLIYDVKRDPLNLKPEHVDFYQVKMDEKIMTKIPLVFIGQSLAVSDLGGVLVKAIQEVEVRALPADLSHEIEINISKLKNFEDNILVKDIIAPKGVEILENPETPVASVVPPRSEEELAALSKEVAEKVEEVKVETEEKTAARAEVKTETKAEGIAPSSQSM